MPQTTTLTPASTRQAWDRIAPQFDQHVTPTGGWALPEEALDRLGVGEGTRFLDVASGSGAVALAAARRGADVLAVDISPIMLQLLRTRAASEGLARVEGRVMDGHVLDLDDDSFDAAASQFGVMLFEDLPRGVRQMVRVTRPGGRVGLTAFGPPEGVGFLTLFLGALRSVVPDFRGLPQDPPPRPFQVADADKLRQVFLDAGLMDVHIEPSIERFEVASGQDLWDWVLGSNPIPGMLIADLSQEQRDQAKAALDDLVRRKAGPYGAAVIDSNVHIATGTVPGGADTFTAKGGRHA